MTSRSFGFAVPGKLQGDFTEVRGAGKGVEGMAFKYINMTEFDWKLARAAEAASADAVRKLKEAGLVNLIWRDGHLIDVYPDGREVVLEDEE